MVVFWTSLLGSHRNLGNLLEVLNTNSVQVVLAKFQDNWHDDWWGLSEVQLAEYLRAGKVGGVAPGPAKVQAVIEGARVGFVGSDHKR